MNKGASYSLIAMVFLLVVALGLGVYARLSKNIINVSADAQLGGLPQLESPCRVQPVLLKIGVNTFNNTGISFSLEDAVILVNGKLITFLDAQKRNIIGGVVNKTKNMGLKEGVLGVATGDDFSVEVVDASVSPQLCLKGIK